MGTRLFSNTFYLNIFEYNINIYKLYINYKVAQLFGPQWLNQPNFGGFGVTGWHLAQGPWVPLVPLVSLRLQFQWPVSGLSVAPPAHQRSSKTMLSSERWGLGNTDRSGDA